MTEVEKLIEGVNKKSRKDFSRLLTRVNTFSDDDKKIIWKSYLEKKSQPKILGVTGTPGAGKSTFLNNLLLLNNRIKKRIGLVLIDPASPLDGGAILGDRIRLSEHFLDETIYIRSISNQGIDDGLPAGFCYTLMIFCLFNFDIVIVETVGGGQANVVLREYVDQLILIFDPSSGDDIQHLKSGILSVCDDLVVSKTDIIPSSQIQNSLEEWSAFNGNVTMANLLNPDALSSFLNTRVFSSEKKPRKNLIPTMLKLNLYKELKAVVDNFSLNYFENKLITEEVIQDYKKNFLEYIFKKY